MKTILTIITYTFISASVMAGGLNLKGSEKPAPKKEARADKKSPHKPKKSSQKVKVYLMDNGEYYIPKRKPKINYHYYKPGSKTKKR